MQAQSARPVGAGIGIGEQIAGVESPLDKVKRLAKTMYGLSLPNTEANQIVSIAQQKFFGNIDTTLRSPEVRQMLGLYAAGTGQKFPLSATTPHGASLVEQGGIRYTRPRPTSTARATPIKAGYRCWAGRVRGTGQADR